MSDTPHQTFYKYFSENYKLSFFLISNKPFKGDKTKLPSNVGLICNQNFQNYAGPFAHRGLFISANEVLSMELEHQTESAENSKDEMKEEDLESMDMEKTS